MPKTLPARRGQDHRRRKLHRCGICGTDVPDYYLATCGCWDCYEPLRAMKPRDKIPDRPKSIEELRNDQPDQVERILAAMPPAMRRTVVMVHFQKLSQREVARRRHVTESAVAHQLDRAAKHFIKAGLPEPTRPSRTSARQVFRHDG